MRPFQRKQGPRPEKVKHTATGRRIASAEHSNLRAIPDSSRSGLTEREVKMHARRVRIRMLVPAERVDEIADLLESKDGDESEAAAPCSNPTARERRLEPSSFGAEPRTRSLRTGEAV